MSYSLIKWINGSDAGKYTVLETECVKQFDYNKYKIGDLDESYVVEWREGKKPLGGYPLFDGQILQVSDNKWQLEKLIDEMITPRCSQILKNSKPNSKGKGSLKATAQSVSDKALLSDITNLQNRSQKRVTDDDTSLKELQRENRRLKIENDNLTSNAVFLNNEIAQKDEELDKIRTEIAYLKDTIITDIPQVLNSCKDLIDKFLISANTQIENDTPNKSQSPQTKSGIYPGSPILADSIALVLAKQNNSVQGFVGDMLTNLFETEVLLKSNYKGGKSKLNATEEARPALDPVIMKELLRAAEIYYPTMKKHEFGKAVNQKIANLRFRAKRLFDAA